MYSHHCSTYCAVVWDCLISFIVIFVLKHLRDSLLIIIISSRRYLNMASVFATICDSLSFGNVLLLLLLLLMLHYLLVLYEFRNMPPGPRLTTIPVLGNVFSLNLNAAKLTDAFQRSVLASPSYRSILELLPSHLLRIVL